MILEGLVTTLNADGTPHLAPMGPVVAHEQFESFILKPYKTSTTFQNLQRHGEGVFHITDDVLLMAKAALGLIGALPALSRAEVNGYYLTAACRTFEFRVTESDLNSERTKLRCDIFKVRELRPFLGFNRAKHAVLEAAILATRFHLKDAAEIDAEYRRLRIIVDKTAGLQEFEAMALLEAAWARKRA